MLLNNDSKLNYAKAMGLLRVSSIISMILLQMNLGHAQQKELNIALYDYPPMSQKKINGSWGYCFDILQKAFPTKKYSLKPHLVSINRALKSTQEAKYDGICSINKDLAKLYQLETAYFNNSKAQLSYWVRKEDKWLKPGKTNLNLFKSKKVIYIKGYNYSSASKEFQRLVESKNSIKLTQNDAIKRAFDLINEKKADMICLDTSHVVNAIKDKTFLKRFKAIPTEFKVIHGFFGISRKHKNKDELLKDYHQGHKKLLRSGQIDKILRSHGLSSSSFIKN